MNPLALLNPTALLAIAVAFGLGFVGGGVSGAMRERARCETNALRAANQVLTDRFATLSTIGKADASRAWTDAKADTANRTAVDATPPNTDACLSRAAAGRVRSVR